ncbi:hypothetical protein BDN72DRAFT_126855 [Pluteus cervinus]|uniref:Uncharacterized protein n=1 Tax=Pluteus cervinus TaxID=181527 RepID=A0ACD3AML3_9AGAR|nr:hypothetical protein BDN72DRAFT_126855 [Pluteus cervinus]
MLTYRSNSAVYRHACQFSGNFAPLSNTIRPEHAPHTIYKKLGTSDTPPEDDANHPQLVIERRKSRIGCRLLAPTLILFTLSGRLAIFLILWLTVINGVDDQTLGTILKNRAFIANEGVKEIATTGVVSLTALFLLGLAGYCIAGMWLSGQESGSILPTPIQ